MSTGGNKYIPDEEETMDDKTFKHITSKMKSAMVAVPTNMPKSVSQQRANVDYADHQLGMNPSTGSWPHNL